MLTGQGVGMGVIASHKRAIIKVRMSLFFSYFEANYGCCCKLFPRERVEDFLG